MKIRIYLLPRIHPLRSVECFARFRCPECDKIGWMSKDQHKGMAPIACLMCDFEAEMDCGTMELVESVMDL